MIDAIDGVSGYSQPEHSTAPLKTAAPRDKVVLSETAQAKLLQQNGLTASEIANQLGISLSTAQSDLDVAIVESQTNSAKA